MLKENIYKILEITSSSSIIIPLSCLVLRSKYFKNENLIIGALIVITLLTEIFNLLYVYLNRNNFFIFRVFTYIEIALITLYYFQFFKSYFKAHLILFVLPAFIVVSAIDYRLNGSESFDNYATSFEAILFSSISLWSFYYMMKHMIFENPTKEPFFWINSGILLYFGGNLVLFVFNNYLLQNKTAGHLAMWAIHSCLNILYNCIIAIGIWKTRRP